MKTLVSAVITLALGIFLGGFVFTFGQDVDSERWVKIDDADGLLTYDVPSDFIVDKDGRGLDYWVRAFGHGVSIEVQADRNPGRSSAFERLEPHDKEEMVGHEFAANNKKSKAAKVKKFSSQGGRSYRIFVISGDRFYRLTVGSIIPGRTALNRFLESIRVNGNPIEQATVVTPPAVETKLTKDLKTSPEVKEARAKVAPKKTDVYSFFPVEDFKLLPAKTDPELRSAVIVEQNFPALLAFAQGEHKIKVVAELLASGLVGKVVVYSNLQEKTLPLIINAAVGIKFIPAKKGQNYVDSVRVIDYSTNVGRPVVHYNMPIPR